MEAKYLDLIDQYREEMIGTLRELLAFKSVHSEPLECAPFGAGVRGAFHYMLDRAKADGFDTENVDDYGGHIEFGGHSLDENGGEIMGVLCHLDVVPEGKDWDYDPYGGEIAEGRIYGRGAIDDKGPAVAAYYAMKALKDAGVAPEKKVRLILGLDEETKWDGMHYYLKRVKHPDFGFSPDAGFPAIHGEKGLLIFDLAKKLGKSAANAKGIALRSVTGGNAPNMVADHARAVIRAASYEAVKEKAAEFRKSTGWQLNTKGIGKSLEITAHGISAHGAMPWKGLSAISILMQFLGQLGLENEDVRDFVDFYNTHIAFDLNGEAMGCGLEDEPSGKLVFNVGMVNIDAESAAITVNIRYPVTLSDERVYEALLPVVGKYNLGLVKKEHKPPIFIPKDDPLIQTLMAIYKKHSGDTECEPIVIGGGTYARAVKNTVAYGAVFPGEPDLAHQKNEYIEIENLVTCAKIFADAIFELAEGQTPEQRA
jgi:succinyl-diaminopimelate desuccinylase